MARLSSISAAFPFWGRGGGLIERETGRKERDPPIRESTDG